MEEKSAYSLFWVERVRGREEGGMIGKLKVHGEELCVSDILGGFPTKYLPFPRTICRLHKRTPDLNFVVLFTRLDNLSASSESVRREGPSTQILPASR